MKKIIYFISLKSFSSPIEYNHDILGSNHISRLIVVKNK